MGRKSLARTVLSGKSCSFWNEEARRRSAIMNEIEKRELIEQQRKILEAGTQRADKRTGSFSFLTWPFFIVPLIASEEFLAATSKSEGAEQEDAKAASAGAAPQAANDRLPASDSAKTSAENEAAREPFASSHTAQFDPAGLRAPSDEAPNLSAAHGEVADAAWGGGGDDSDSRHDEAHTCNSLSEDCRFVCGHLPGGATLESLQSNGLADLLSPSIIGSAPLLGTVGSLSNNVIGPIVPIEAAVQPALASDAVSTLTHDAVGTITSVELSVQPVLAAVTESVSTLSHDVVGTIASVDLSVQPVLAAVTESVSTLSHDVVGTIASVDLSVQPVLAAVTDSVSTLSHDVVGTISSVEPAILPVPAAVTDSVSTLSHDVVGTILSVEPAAFPVMATASDAVSTVSLDVAGTIAPVEVAVQPVLAIATDAVTTLSNDIVSTNEAAKTAVQPVLATATDSVSTLSHEESHPADVGNVAGDVLASVVPVVDTAEPVLPGAGVLHSNPATDLLQPADFSTGQAIGPADTLLALATGTDAPIEVPESAAAGPATVVTTVSNAAAAIQPDAIAGDVIALNDASPPPAHALFTGDHYTDYGVTLTSDVAVPPQHYASAADAASAHDTLPAAVDAQQYTAPPPDILDTTHPIDHLGLRDAIL